MKDTNKIFYLVLFVLALIVSFWGLNVDFFTDDPGLYASVAKNLLYKKDFFELFTYNVDWLDKPHFPFWIILLSFKLFGVSLWAYRLPALLFFLLSLVYTYLFTRKYYKWEIAATAVLILMAAQHILLSNTDVRAEPYLMALLVGGIYHVSRLRERFSFSQLFFAAALTACAVMTKGIFAVIPVYGALLGELAFQKKISHVLQLRWLWLLLLTSVFILPEFYALYRQFDLHPEKTVFGRHHVSGIRWFLWDSQFGRFVNNGPISRKSSGSIFFYLHTLMWAFAPWCLLFYYAVFENVKALFSRQKRAEYYSLCGGLILLLLFSLSRFQLPFYTNAVFPLFAVITAPVCFKQLSRFGTKFRLIAQWLFIILLPVTIIAINFFIKPASSRFFAIDCGVLAIIILLIFTKIKPAHTRVFFLSCATALFAGFYLNTVLYNEIMPYIGQIAAAKYVNQKPFNGFPLYTLKTGNNIYQFYCKRPVDLVPVENFKSFKPTGIPVFYANQQSLDYLRHSHADFTIIKSFLNYPQENILPAFINKTTRHQVLDHVYLITK